VSSVSQPWPVLVTRRMYPGVLADLEPVCRLTVHDEDWPMPRAALLRAAPGQAGLLTTLADRVDGELLDAAGKSLRVVANHAVGAHNIDLPACQAHGVTVTATPDVLTDTTADQAWALLLAAARRLGEGERWVRSGRPWQWAPNFLLGADLTGATLGIVGCGRIGQAIARRAAGFRMTVSYHNRHRLSAAVEEKVRAHWQPLDHLLQASDAVIVSCPLTPDTRGLLNRGRLAQLKPTAVLVSMTGGVVDEGALATALDQGLLFAAALDSYTDEPAIHPALLAHESVVLAPHLGSATLGTRQAMGRLAADNILAVLSGCAPLTPAHT
jgi:glyoxylate reductase